MQYAQAQSQNNKDHCLKAVSSDWTVGIKQITRSEGYIYLLTSFLKNALDKRGWKLFDSIDQSLQTAQRTFFHDRLVCWLLRLITVFPRWLFNCQPAVQTSKIFHMLQSNVHILEATTTEALAFLLSVSALEGNVQTAYLAQYFHLRETSECQSLVHFLEWNVELSFTLLHTFIWLLGFHTLTQWCTALEAIWGSEPYLVCPIAPW